VKLPDAIIYTDGSSGKDGSGGYAALVATPYYGIEISGYEYPTTNNRMELTAAIKGLKLLHEPHNVKLVSDSAYMLNSIKHQWYLRWFDEEKRGINLKNLAKPRPNLDLWLDIETLLCYHTVEPIKVKGHSGIEHNDRVDKLACEARKQKAGRLDVLYGKIVV
jgi:ribonuclease HI